MKKQTQEQRIVSMMKRPIPKRKVSIIKLQMVREGEALYGTKRFRNAREAAEMVRPLFEYSDREMLLVMSLDAVLTPVALEIAAVGSLNVCGVDMREVFKHAVLSNAAKIICFHNHPSGNLEVSREDSLITKRICESGALLGVELLDHIIVGLDGSFISMKEMNMLPIGKWEGEAS